jgi:hypothetical protein
MRMRPRAAALAISLVVAAGGTGGGAASQAAAATTDDQDVSLENGTQKASGNSESSQQARTDSLPSATGPDVSRP